MERNVSLFQMRVTDAVPESCKLTPTRRYEEQSQLIHSNQSKDRMVAVTALLEDTAKAKGTVLRGRMEIANLSKQKHRSVISVKRRRGSKKRGYWLVWNKCKNR